MKFCPSSNPFGSGDNKVQCFLSLFLIEHQLFIKHDIFQQSKIKTILSIKQNAHILIKFSEKIEIEHSGRF